MTARLTVEQKRLARRLKAKGLSLREIGREVGCSHEVIRAIAAGRGRERDGKPDQWSPAPGRLTLADREEISLRVQQGDAFNAIAGRLGRATSTVSREVAANGGRGNYRAWRAHQRARVRARRPKTPKLTCPRLAATVAKWLEEWWSTDGDLPPVAHRVRGRSDDVGEPRDHLSGSFRAGTRRAAQGAYPLPADREDKATPQAHIRERRKAPGHGHDQRASRRGS